MKRSSILLAAWIAFLPRSVAGSELPSLAGHWVGNVPLGDGETPKLVVDLGKLGSRWVGEFDVEEFGVENYPVHIEFSDSTVKLHFSAADGDFEGRLSPGGDRLTGTLGFSEQKIVVEFQRVGAVGFSESFLQLEAAADDPSKVEKLSASGAELRKRFNADRGKVRLVMLLSPT